MILAALVTGIFLLLGVLLPFVSGKGGMLTDAASVKSPEKLAALKEALLNRYLEDEKAAETNLISKRTWQKRRQFLINRYIDAARRLDFIRANSEGQKESRQ